jgi:uncharacterized protein YcbK (DUF882 family)
MGVVECIGDERGEPMQRFVREVPGTLVALALTLAAMASHAGAGEFPRFAYSGDGRLHLVNAKSGAAFEGAYRSAEGHYDPAALKAIQRVFDAPPEEPLAAIALRLIEFLDYLEVQLNPGARIEIASGWRSPVYNERLRAAGRLAATASMHQYGMAADIHIDGVRPRRIWEFVRALGFGGTGYYQGRLVHVDVGPARSWDQTSSGVGTGISADNKLIGLVTDFDRYRAGEAVTMRFIRMTRFPVGVQTQWVLERHADDGPPVRVTDFKPAFGVDTAGPCLALADFGQMLGIAWPLPADLAPGRYAVRAGFCEQEWEAMPEAVVTPVFEVVGR